MRKFKENFEEAMHTKFSRRCFIGINFPDNIKEEIVRIQNLIKKDDIFNGKFTEKENLHLALKFLGEIDEIKIGKVKDRLKEIKFSSFECVLGKIGVFSRREVRIMWIKIDGIYDLQKEIDRNLKNLFDEERRFMSHITIARVKSIKDEKRFFEVFNKIKIRNLSFEVNEFNFMESELRKNGPVYRELEKYKIKS